MFRTISLRLALPILIAAVLLPLAAVGQSQDSQTQSVAEAARKARAQKKPSAKPVPVITDDDLKPPTPAEKAVEAATEAKAQAASATSASSAAAPSANAGSASNGDDAEQKKKNAAQLQALQQQLADANKSLDLLQREFALQQETFLSNPDHAQDPAGQAKLDAMKQQIADKQQEVDTLKTRVAALQELAGTPAPAPQNPQP